MSPSLHTRLIVALAAVAAAAVVAGVVYATRQDPPQVKALCKQASAFVVPGVPSTHTTAVEAAMKRPPKQAAETLGLLAQQSPKDPVVLFNEGQALACAGYLDDAAAAWRRAKKAGRNTFYEIKADNFLHPQYFAQGGYPPFYYDGHEALLVQGQLQQRQGHQHSAEALWAKAAKLRPDDPDAQVAAAVGRFDMDDLSASFSRLGPLVRRFPKSQTVRFHLGLLLSWTGQRDLAIKEFRAAKALGPSTTLGTASNSLLKAMARTGSSRPKR
jgi:tetratricopeptide (TPR) repeat protein